MFRRVLVANRGEIAVRITRTLQRMGIEAVVVASIPDRQAMAVRHADDWALLEGHTPAESYLDQEAVLVVARDRGCEAIHPGYGFLAENADFAEQCARAGVVFIGPSPDTLRRLGDKAAARRIAIECGVPVVSGYDGPDDDATLIREANTVGFPLVLKARAGGGGRGMRVVRDGDSLPEAIDAARREAAAAFGDPSLLIERLIERAHHVEVQVIGDTHGGLIHLGERDCSVQRRYQKLIEEAPGPIVDERLRESLTTSALAIAETVGYTNAGTFEFLVGAPGEGGRRPFWFIEANPRLQVEHPVTEAITGLDLVELQIRVAAGEPLPVRQTDVHFNGHAIEARLYAEDPQSGFQPATGRLRRVDWSSSASRVDTGYASGDVVPPNYDTMIAKVIAHAPTRAESIAAVARALDESQVEGLPTNRSLLREVVLDDAFAAGDATVDWLGPSLDSLVERSQPSAEGWIAAAAVLALQGPWLGAGPRTIWISDCDQTRGITVHRKSPTSLRLSGVDGGETAAELLERPQRGEVVGRWIVRVGTSVLHVDSRPGGVCVVSDDSRWLFAAAAPPPLPRSEHALAEGSAGIVAPLSGTIAAVHVAEGDVVETGELLFSLEAMKMEHRIAATQSGTVQKLHAIAGESVSQGQLLAEIS
jgi:acetyl/propionyl-CoA carboxylase alpha subunit